MQLTKQTHTNHILLSFNPMLYLQKNKGFTCFSFNSVYRFTIQVWFLLHWGDQMHFKWLLCQLLNWFHRHVLSFWLFDTLNLQLTQTFAFWTIPLRLQARKQQLIRCFRTHWLWQFQKMFMLFSIHLLQPSVLYSVAQQKQQLPIFNSA